MEIRKKGSSNKHQHAHSNSFATAIAVIFGMIILAIVGQNISGKFESEIIKGSIAFATLMIYIIVFLKPLRRIIDTPYTAISSLLGIAIGTSIGTFITQNTLPEAFRLRYGETLSRVFEFFHCNDVFHSWWYVGLFVIMGASLIKRSWGKGFHRSSWGFHLAHLSPIIILAGFWIDYFYGFRGIISLEVDQVTNEAKVYRDHTNYTKGTAILPFKVRLDSFEFEKHDPDYRIQVWQRDADEVTRQNPDGTISTRKTPGIKASFPLKQKKVRRIYGTDIKFWMLDFYPNFAFDYSYPEDIDTITVDVPGVLVDIVTSVGEATLHLKENDKGQNILTDPILGASLEFYWDPPENVFTPLFNENYDTSSVVSAHGAHAGRLNWLNLDRVVFSGKDRKIYFVTNDGVTDYDMEKGKFFPISGMDGTGFTFRFFFPAMKFMQSFPTTKNDDLENPVARIQVWSEAINPAQTVFLYPGMNTRGGTYIVPGTDYLIALESFREMETKYWKSDLAILDSDDNVLKEQSIVVNEPMHISGYRLYQSDYDPDNPAYSGIGITYTPGLYTVYLGFILMVLGTLMLFYWRQAPQESIMTQSL